MTDRRQWVERLRSVVVDVLIGAVLITCLLSALAFWWEFYAMVRFAADRLVPRL